MMSSKLIILFIVVDRDARAIIIGYCPTGPTHLQMEMGRFDTETKNTETKNCKLKSKDYRKGIFFSKLKSYM